MTEENNNLALWKAVGTTNTKYTKESTQKGGFTSINPYYQIEQATAQWGPYGTNWGLKDIELDYSILQLTGFIIYKAVFHCPVSEFSITNNVEPVTGKGYRDSDFMKKVETDTITKALSRLGFNNDVFKGQYDDFEYVSGLKAEEELEAAEDKEKFNSDKFNEIQKEVESGIKVIQGMPTIKNLNNYARKLLSKTQKRLQTYKFRPDTFDQRINKAAELQKQKIENNQGK